MVYSLRYLKKGILNGYLHVLPLLALTAPIMGKRKAKIISTNKTGNKNIKETKI